MAITRRALLRYGLVGVGGALLAACGGAPPTAVPAKPTGAPAPTEAPKPAAAAPTATTAPAKPGPEGTPAPKPATEPTKPAAAPAAGSKTQLQAAKLIWWTNDGKQGERVKPVYQEFSKQNPQIQVEDLTITGALAEKLATAGAANQLPDLYYARTFTSADHALKGWLLDITPYVQRDAQEVNLDDLEPLMVVKEKWQGKWYSQPENFSDYGVYYNKKLFDDAKVSYPKDDWTWPEYLETARKLTRTEGGKTAVYGTDWGYLGNWVWWGLMHGEGGQLLTPDLKKAVVNSKENAEIVQFFADLVHVHKVAPAANALPKGMHPFGNGLVAMHLGGSWEPPALRDAVKEKFDWDVAAMPKGKTGKFGVNIEGGCYGIGASSKYREEAWQLLKFSTSKKGIEDMVNATLFSLPGRLSTRPSWLESASKQKPQHAPAFFDILKNVPPAVPALPYFEEFSRTFDNRITGVLSGESKAADVLPQLEKELNDVIAKTPF